MRLRLILFIAFIVVLALASVWLVSSAKSGPAKAIWALFAIAVLGTLIRRAAPAIRVTLGGKDKSVARAIAALTECPHCHVRSLEWIGTSVTDVLHDDPDRRWFDFRCRRCTGKFEFNRRSRRRRGTRPDDEMSRFRGYTDRADKTIREAATLSRKRRDKSAGPEHLFLALDPDGLAGAVLKRLHSTPEDLKKEFQSACRLEKRPPGRFPPFSDKMLEVLERARRIGRPIGHNYVGDEHLLLSLAQVASPVADFLSARDLTFEAIRKEVLLVLGVDDRSWTPLTYAAANGDVARARLLLESGADINAKDSFGYTPLLWAASCGESELADLFIAEGADVNAGDKIGRMPLHHAVVGGCGEVVDLLIAKGANVNAADIYGTTALWLAGRNKPSVADALRRGGAKEGRLRDGEVPGAAVTKDGIPDHPTENRLKFTPLHWAVYRGERSAVELLISKGADVNARDRGGGTPLISAAYRGDRGIVELLIAAGADVNAVGFGGETPLYGAATAGHKELIELLIAGGADINAKNIHGWTPLHAAAYHGNKEAAAVLVARGANVDAKNKEGRTPLQFTIDNLHAAVEEVLRKAGAKEQPSG